MSIPTVLLNAPGVSHFMRLIRAGVIKKFEGITCFVEEDKFVSSKFLDNLVARWVCLVVHLVGWRLSILAHTGADEINQGR